MLVNHESSVTPEVVWFHRMSLRLSTLQCVAVSLDAQYKGVF